MCKPLRSLGTALGVLAPLLGAVPAVAVAQDYASLASWQQQTAPRRNVRLLRDWLDRLARQHNVRFAINDQVVANKYADGSLLRLANLDEALTMLLKPHGLTYKKVADYYVIQAIDTAPVMPQPRRNEAPLVLGETTSLSAVTALRYLEPGQLRLPVRTDQPVRGVVRDSTNGQPLPGVSVVLKGS